MWVTLSEGLFYFGNGGITRIEPVDNRYVQGESEYKTVLYSGTSKVTSVKNSVDEISTLVYNNSRSE